MGAEKFLFLVVVLFANVMEAVTGFAGTMLAMPPAMLLIGVQEAKVVLNVVAILVSATIALKNIKHINKRESAKIAAFMLAGMAAGLYIFERLPVGALIKVYGVLILAVAARGLFGKKQAVIPAPALGCVLLGAGVIHGMFLSGGALLVLYAVTVLKDKTVIRATLAPVWLLLNAFLLVGDIVAGRFTDEIISLSLFSVIPVAAALVIGGMLHKSIKQAAFRKLTYCLLIVSGITLLI